MTKKEKQIALNSWYACMIAMGSIPKDEDLYFKARNQFMDSLNIEDFDNIETTCDKDFEHIKKGYIELSSKRYMSKGDIEDCIFSFISKHESNVSTITKKQNEGANVRFTTYGNRAARKAIHEIIEFLDDETRMKVIELMKNSKT